MSTIKVLFFASLKEKVGTKQLSLGLPDNSSVVDLRILLSDQYPGARESLRACLVAVNRSFAFDQDMIPPEAEVAFFPPVSGG